MAFTFAPPHHFMLLTICADVYACVQSEGKLEEKLHEMYRWGKTYGWEPVVHVDGVPQPPLTALTAQLQGQQLAKQ